MKNEDLRIKLGLNANHTAYFLRAPQEYWQALGMRQAPYDDNSGEYDFIHAFFESKEELKNFSDILLSKLSHGGIMWISFPKRHEKSSLSREDAREVFEPLGLKAEEEIGITDNWLAVKFVWKNQ